MLLFVLALVLAAPAVCGAQDGPAAPLPLADAVRAAQAHSKLRAAARERLDAAATARERTPRLPNPIVELRSENFGAVSSATLPRDSFAVVTQPVELGGKRRARQRQAQTLEEVARHGLVWAQWNVVLTVVDRYVAAVRADGHVRALDEHREGLAELVRVMRERTSEGLAPEADLRRLESERAGVDRERARAAIDRDRELALLGTLVGHPVAAASLVVPAANPMPAAAEVTRERTARRADVASAAARVAALEATADLARAQGVPDLLVSGGYKRTSGLDTGVAAVTVPIPLFDRNGAEVARAAGEARAARLELELLEEQAMAEARAQIAAARALQEEAARADREQVAAATVVRDAARAAFEERTADVLRLVDAEREYTEAMRDVLDLKLDAALAWMHARLALGEDPLP